MIPVFRYRYNQVRAERSWLLAVPAPSVLAQKGAGHHPVFFPLPAQKPETHT